MSERKSTSALSLHCSGDMYAWLPMISPACVRMVPPVPPGRFISRSPKSRIFTRSPPGAAASGTRNRFSGFRSRERSGGHGQQQGRTGLVRDLHGLRQGETPLSARRFCAHPFEKLHSGYRARLGCHASVEDFDDVAMTDGAGSPGFVEKTPDQLGILGQRLVQDLDGGRDVQMSGFSGR